MGSTEKKYRKKIYICIYLYGLLGTTLSQIHITAKIDWNFWSILVFTYVLFCVKFKSIPQSESL